MCGDAGTASEGGEWAEGMHALLCGSLLGGGVQVRVFITCIQCSEMCSFKYDDILHTEPWHHLHTEHHMFPLLQVVLYSLPVLWPLRVL